MPIDIDGQTIWVECVEQQKGGVLNNGDVVMDLGGNEGEGGASAEIPPNATAPGGAAGGKGPAKTLTYTPKQKEDIVRLVSEECISPMEVGKKHNISAHTIRDWVKKAGKLLPTR